MTVQAARAMPYTDFLRYAQLLPLVKADAAYWWGIAVKAAFSDDGLTRLRHIADGWTYEPLRDEQRDALQGVFGAGAVT